MEGHGKDSSLQLAVERDVKERINCEVQSDDKSKNDWTEFKFGRLTNEQVGTIQSRTETWDQLLENFV